MTTINTHDIDRPSQFPYNEGKCNTPHMVHESSNTTNSHDITLEPNSHQKVQKLQDYAKRTTRFKPKSCEKVSRVRLPTRMTTRNAHDITHPFQFPYDKGKCNIPHMVHKSSNTTNSHNITPEPNSHRKGKKIQHSANLATWLRNKNCEELSRVRLPAKEEEEKEDTTRPDVKDDAKPQRADALELEQAAVEAAAPRDRAVMEVERAMAAMASSLLRNQSFGTPGAKKTQRDANSHSLSHTQTHTVTTLAPLSCLDNAVCWMDE